MLHVSPLTKGQVTKIIKALIYSFVSGFAGSFTLITIDVLTAVQGGYDAVSALLTSLLVGAVVAGINAVLVTVKQLFTEEKK